MLMCREQLVVATLLVICASLFLSVSVKVQASVEKRWNFRVYLDDKEIGYHQVRLVPDADRQRVSVEARFDVKFLFLTAYSYEHRTEELWQGACLADIRSQTDDNGETQYIRGQPLSKGIRLVTHDSSMEITGCVRSFAYWNPELLKTSLLGRSKVDIKGDLQDAYHYRLLVEESTIDLWYTPDMNWLALQTNFAMVFMLAY